MPVLIHDWDISWRSILEGIHDDTGHLALFGKQKEEDKEGEGPNIQGALLQWPSFLPQGPPSTAPQTNVIVGWGLSLQQEGLWGT